MVRSISLASVAVLAGCYSSHGDRLPAVDPTMATLILDLDLPATTPGGRFALVQVRDSSFGFEDIWLGRDPTFPLETVAIERTVRQVSDDDTMNLRVKVRLCEIENCSASEDIDARECRFEIEQPFYLGVETHVALAVPSSGCTTVTRVGRCEVAGCAGGAATTHCRPDGTHLCE